MLTSWQLLVDLVAAPLEDGLLILWDGDGESKHGELNYALHYKY